MQEASSTPRFRRAKLTALRGGAEPSAPSVDALIEEAVKVATQNAANGNGAAEADGSLGGGFEAARDGPA